jgi:hypothetical protein
MEFFEPECAGVRALGLALLLAALAMCIGVGFGAANLVARALT